MGLGALRLKSPLQLESTCPRQTAVIGAAVARLSAPGDVVALIGELGSGKTQFVRGMAEGLALAPRVVSSPTFVLMHEYGPSETAPLLVHIDAYRLAGPEELGACGWDDVRPDAITVVEWADRVRAALGDHVLQVHLTHTEGGRQIELSPEGGWVTRLPRLAQACREQLAAASGE